MLLSVLILLGITALLIPPLLGFMNTGLKVVQSQELKTRQLYAAEAGVEDALWRIQNNVTGSDSVYECPALNINNNSVNANISKISPDTYKIVSEAVFNADNSRKTTIESYLEILDLSVFTEGAITSPGSVDIQPNGNIEGTVTSPYIWIQGNPLKTYITDPVEAPVSGWPSATEAAKIAEYYKKQVDTASPYSAALIDVSQADQRGPLYVYNDSVSQFFLTGPGLVEGTIYVAGNLELGGSGNLDIGGNTIFVEGNITSHPQLTLRGTGSIIALGNISFQPNSSSNEFIFLMAVTGSVNFQPTGDFVGAVAGNIEVNLQPNCCLQWVSPPGALNLPGVESNLIGEIKTWTIK